MGQLVYLYGFIPHSETEEEPLSDRKGFDNKSSIYSIPLGSMQAVVCGLDEDEFSEKAIQEKTENDMKWLQEKALHHHETIMELYSKYPLIPLQFCTIYKGEDRIHETVAPRENEMQHILEQLKEKEEWNLKIYCDDKQLKEDVRKYSPVIEEKIEEINQLSPGRKFFEMKKIDSLLEEEAEKEITKICEDAHERLNEYADKALVKKNWSKEMTGRNEDMCWNSVYFLNKTEVANFQNEMTQLEKSLENKGFTLELSGPWPAYHFADLK